MFAVYLWTEGNSILFISKCQILKNGKMKEVYLNGQHEYPNSVFHQAPSSKVLRLTGSGSHSSTSATTQMQDGVFQLVNASD